MDISRIRNFCIIAHIDHGKSTLADRFLEIGGLVDERTRRAQMLDTMELERERGITIKAQAVRLEYRSPRTGETYLLNLIDTPGHVDFSYEVSRSLAACEGALLLVDASQGVEAQTIANAYLAIENNLEIIPVINKIDLPEVDIEAVKTQMWDALGLDPEEAILVSAKTGQGMEQLLDAVIERIPPPQGDSDAPLKALIFDSFYDSYQGVVAYVRIFDGTLRKGDKIRCFSSRGRHEINGIGIFTPAHRPVESLSAGEVGYFTAGIKDIREVRVGDTVTHAVGGCEDPLPGYKEPKPVVFCGLYTTDNADYEALRDALAKLRLNDASFVYEPDTSAALGFGFRCGFLGLLHMEIVQERLERDFDLELVATAPSVVYRVVMNDGSVMELQNPSKLPASGEYREIHEPYVEAKLYFPPDYMGAVMELVKDRRGVNKDVQYLGPSRLVATCEFPFAEILVDFHDRLKSVTRGYASMEYEFIGYRKGDLCRLDILLGGDPIDAFCTIVPRSKAYYKGRDLVSKLKELIPRQLFEVVIQAAADGRIISSAKVKALRKNVLAKCYGGDVTRKRKLLEKQKEGKKRMKRVGKVQIPQEAFFAVLSVD